MPNSHVLEKKSDSWKILVVDDDIYTHKSTKIVLQKEQLDDKNITLLHAYSGSQAKIILENNHDIAVVLLDLIMEGEEAGLDVIKFIRARKALKATRIIIRTGQPGKMGKEETIFKLYDIHDYKDKNMMTASKLKNCIISGIRAYRDITREITQHKNQSYLFVTLSEISNRQISIKKGLHFLVKNMQKIFYAELCCLYYFSEDELVNKTWYAADEHLLKDLQVKNDQKENSLTTFVKKSIEEGTSIVKQDVHIDCDVLGLKEKYSFNAEKIIVFPVYEEERLIAAFEIYMGRDFPEFDQHMVIVNAAISQLSDICRRVNYEDRLSKKYIKLTNVFNRLSALVEDVDKKDPTKEIDKLSDLENNYNKMLDKTEILSKKLSETQSRLSNIIDAVPCILFSINNEMRIIDWNKTISALMGISSINAINKNIADVAPLFYKNFKDKINFVIENQQPYIERNISNHLAPQSLEHVNYDLYMYPFTSEEHEGVVIKLDDTSIVSEFKNMMQRNIRLISLGELAPGLSDKYLTFINSVHTINNILQQRLNANNKKNIELLSSFKINPEKMQAFLDKEKIPEFLESLASICKDEQSIVSVFSDYCIEGDLLEPTNVDLLQIMKDCVKIIKLDKCFNIKHTLVDTQISIDSSDDTLPFFCNAAEMRLAFVNVLLNSLQFLIAEKIQKPMIKININLQDEFYIVTIEDNGPGIKKEHIPKIFKPFFSTKSNGLGLGLSISKDIIYDRCHGDIDVNSVVGQGTTITIKIPIKAYEKN